MSELTVALGLVAPYYNLGFVIIAIVLFIILFKTPIKNKKIFVTPWKYLFLAVCVFILEEILTVLRTLGILDIPVHINGFFELIIISLFIYMLLLQKEHIQKQYH